MVSHMDNKQKVTVTLPARTVDTAKQAAERAHVNFSAYTERALRNETLRQQLAATPLPAMDAWLDDAEADEDTAA